MEHVNKDEAFRCISIGKEYYNNCDYIRALKFFEKSFSMFPNDNSKSWILKTEREIKNKTNNNQKNNNNTYKSNNINNNKKDSSPVFTNKHKEDIERIISVKNDYYKVLKVNRNDHCKIIEKSFKKIVVKIHPDRNPHPNANEAFTILQSAKECLTNKRNREIYNATGNDPSLSRHKRNPVYSTYRNTNNTFIFRRGNSYTFYEGPDIFSREFNPEMFFRQNVRQASSGSSFQRQTRQRTTEKPDKIIMLLFQLFLAIAFIILLFYSSKSITLPNSDSFSFTKTRTHNKEYQTKSGIKFYVNNKTFDKKKLQEIEDNIIKELTKQCEKEQYDYNKFIKSIEHLSKKIQEDIKYKNRYKYKMDACNTLNNKNNK